MVLLRQLYVCICVYACVCVSTTNLFVMASIFHPQINVPSSVAAHKKYISFFEIPISKPEIHNYTDSQECKKLTKVHKFCSCKTAHRQLKTKNNLTALHKSLCIYLYNLNCWCWICLIINKKPLLWTNFKTANFISHRLIKCYCNPKKTEILYRKSLTVILWKWCLIAQHYLYLFNAFGTLARRII